MIYFIYYYLNNFFYKYLKIYIINQQKIILNKQLVFLLLNEFKNLNIYYLYMLSIFIITLIYIE